MIHKMILGQVMAILCVRTSDILGAEDIKHQRIPLLQRVVAPKLEDLEATTQLMGIPSQAGKQKVGTNMKSTETLGQGVKGKAVQSTEMLSRGLKKPWKQMYNVRKQSYNRT